MAEQESVASSEYIASLGRIYVPNKFPMVKVGEYTAPAAWFDRDRARTLDWETPRWMTVSIMRS